MVHEMLVGVATTFGSVAALAVVARVILGRVLA
jgi:hypothetical protein